MFPKCTLRANPMAKLIFNTTREVERLTVERGKQTDFFHASERGLGLRASYGGRKTYFVRYRLEGRQRRASIGSHPYITLEEARRLCRALLADVAKGNDPAAERLKRGSSNVSLIFEDAVADYIEKYAKPKRRSWDQAEATLTRNFLGPWGKLSVRSIDKGMVREVLEGLVEAGTPSAANQAFATVRSFFRWAVETDRCSSSPCTHLRMPARERPRSRVLRDHEIRSVWQAADRLGGPYCSIIKLLFLTGQRRTEVAGLRRTELDLDAKLWTLPAWRNKSSREHQLPLTPKAIDVIRELPDLGELLFPARGREDRSVSGFSKWKKRLDELSGISGWVLHDIRRTVATRLASQGTALHIIRRIQNHSDAIPGVSRVYNQYSYLPEVEEALNTWQSKLLTLVSATSLDNPPR